MLRALGFLLLPVVILGCKSIPIKGGIAEKQLAPLEASYLSGYQKLYFQDQQRNKTLETWTYYPVERHAPWIQPKGPYPWNRISDNGAMRSPREHKPLIVLSHGFAGSPDEFYWLIQPLVDAGYMVIATKHADSPGPQVNHWNRALDVSFILTEFLKTPMGQQVDQTKIGFTGFSLGGMTGIALAGARIGNLDAIVPNERYVRDPMITTDARAALLGLNREKMQSDLHDSRIKAAFLMAPAWSWVFYAKDVSQITIPIYIVAGDQDEVLVTETNGLWYAEHIAKSRFQWVLGAGHFVFLGLPTCEGRTLVDPNGSMTFLYKDKPGVSRSYIQSHVARDAVAFFQANL